MTSIKISVMSSIFARAEDWCFQKDPVMENTSKIFFFVQNKKK
jgi:hypothetical protein